MSRPALTADDSQQVLDVWNAHIATLRQKPDVADDALFAAYTIRQKLTDFIAESAAEPEPAEPKPRKPRKSEAAQ